MSIFGEQQQPEKTDFEKLGVNVIRPYKKNGKWLFNKNGAAWPMAPAGITDVGLSPVVVGADRAINIACQMKGIENPENGFCLLFSETYFPTCDVKFTYKEDKFDGWIYDVQSENLQGLMAEQQTWVCPYLGFYFDKPPQTLYLKVEPHDGRSDP